ncbi:RIP metalloprotease [Chloroflexota bacterium]
MLITVVSFLGILIVLVLAHEIGHFVTARAFGVRVEEFGLGFPPRLLSIKRGETLYSLNVVPLGGFVKMSGEEDPKVPGSLASKSTGTRILVLASGSLMNALLPLLLFSIAFMVPHNVVAGEVMVQGVSSPSPAAEAGIVPGDVLLEADGRQLRSTGDLSRYVQINLGQEITILVRHSDATMETVKVVPRWRPPEGRGAIGVFLENSNYTIVSESYPFWQAIPMAVGECIETFILFKNAIISMIIGAVPVVLAGPVGIAQMTGKIARIGFSPLLEFAAFFSINLAIINIFPLPALDGGRIAFVFLEWVRRGKRVSPKIEGYIHLVGFFMLIAAALLITYQDILRIISGESLIP